MGFSRVVRSWNVTASYKCSEQRQKVPAPITVIASGVPTTRIDHSSFTTARTAR
jgi:hypothetical protein